MMLFGERVKPGNRKKLQILLVLSWLSGGLYYWLFAPQGTQAIGLAGLPLAYLILAAVIQKIVAGLFGRGKRSAEQLDKEVLRLAIALSALSLSALVWQFFQQ
ncbi:hypothetical protein [Phaeodactylibacter luteus]|uniref:Uncharacterized protein n=1 Tax=Phaeodactylibacter luteus TaxID=1564516 RepID=A0A5C6RG25_9BACT|nr:hypothetical protein [Phaeodactylibacter luteus]TXB61276.1 hypothetical protein FRY97_19980 [Phaeodactylibacter luteus]